MPSFAAGDRVRVVNYGGQAPEGQTGYVRAVVEGMDGQDDDTQVMYAVEVPNCPADPGPLWFLTEDEVVPADAPAAPTASGGRKDQGARFDLIPVLPLWHLAALYTAGAQKYEARNWEAGFDWSKSYAALQRHAQRFWMGEDNDPETGQPHLAAVAFHAFALMEFAETRPDLDDRPKAGGQVPLAQIKSSVIREA